jgi:hypothetical protein
MPSAYRTGGRGDRTAQPLGQVPFTAVLQVGGVWPPGPLQHSWVESQQDASQQNWLVGQAMPWQGLSMQVPLLQ